MKHFSFYRQDTGELTGQTFSSTIEGHEKLNTPAGCGVKEGRFDHLCQRVDISHPDHPVIDWQPPAPSGDHEWDEVTRRWLLKKSAAAKQEARATALQRIAELEAQQSRALRELALGKSGARDRLQRIDDEIASLRPDIRA